MDTPDPETLPYEVGRGKPPKEHQFKAGQPSANPHGRKGKAENRDRIAAKQLSKCAQNTAAATLRRAAERPRRVTTSDGVTRSMTTLDVVVERISAAAAAGDVRTALKFVAMVHDHDRQGGRAQVQDPAPTVGPMVIGATCNTMDETLEQLEMEQRRHQLRHELAELEGAVAVARNARTGGPLPQAPPDARETRAYSEGGLTRSDRREAGSPSLSGRSLKADGSYR